MYWVHGVSVGETKAGEILLREIKANIPNATCVVSAVTQDGYDVLRKMDTKPDFIVPLPCDCRLIARRFIKKIKPSAFIIIDGDYWPGFIFQATKLGCHTFVVNGKLSERSSKRYPAMQLLLGDIFKNVTHFYLQSSNYCERFEKLGVPSQKLSVVGNIKAEELARVPSEEIRVRPASISPIKIVTFGSVHPEELACLLPAIKKLSEHSTYRAIIIPRHPGKFSKAKVRDLFGQTNIDYFESWDPDKFSTAVVWVNALGVLKKAYEMSTTAFVGGTFNHIGGHNLIEPALFGAPVFFGPNTSGQQALRDVVDKYHLGSEVKTSDALVNAILSASDKWKDGEITHALQEFRSDYAGLSTRIIKEIQSSI